MKIQNISTKDLIDFFLNKETHDYKEDLLKKFKYFNPNYVEESQHIVALINEEIVGILSYTQNKVFSLNYVTVNPDFQNQKIATFLIKSLLDLIKEGTLINSYYTEEGIKLIETNKNLSEAYPMINWVHKINNDYQSVKGPVLSIGDKVVFLFETEWKEGFVIGFNNTENYLINVQISIDNKNYVVEQSPLFIKKIN